MCNWIRFRLNRFIKQKVDYRNVPLCWVGLGQVRLGQVGLGQVGLGQVRLG